MQLIFVYGKWQIDIIEYLRHFKRGGFGMRKHCIAFFILHLRALEMSLSLLCAQSSKL